MEDTAQFKKVPLEIAKSLEYNPDTGRCVAASGCKIKRKEGREVYSHPELGEFALPRVIWVKQTGNQPGSFVVDHKDRDPFNQEWENLRLATREQNSQNKSMHRNNTSGVKGVYWDKTARKWRARISSKGKTLFSKYYKEEDLWLAEKEIVEAREKLHNEFACNG